jgi:type IV secretion system protein VirB6
MFTWVGAKFDAILSTYVLGVVSALMASITPLALSAMTLWVGLYGWAVLRREVAETVPVFLWKVFKIGLVLAFALQSAVYLTHVADAANALSIGVARTFLPAGVDPATVATPYTLLDKFNDDASTQVSDIMKEASMFRLDLLLAAAIFSIGSILFLCVGLFIVTLSKLLLAFVIAIGPLFILSLAWRPTARFFDSWLSMALNCAVLTWFAFFALGLSAYMGAAMFKAITDGGGFLGGSFNVLGEATRYCVLMILMAILCFQAPGLASALTGGPAVQQGVQMIQNLLLVSGLRSVSAGRTLPGGPASAGGVVTPGPLVPHAGRQVAGAARQGYAAVRSAAYRLAALRGRP